mmetsp:Transcript_101800/g.255222  ORF Transcript_101800/g.255222 Transcript_101800/m.255222 type:complete len:213 (-) Transcript_101800:550-1188(-)
MCLVDSQGVMHRALVRRNAGVDGLLNEADILLQSFCLLLGVPLQLPRELVEELPTGGRAPAKAGSPGASRQGFAEPSCGLVVLLFALIEPLPHQAKGILHSNTRELNVIIKLGRFRRPTVLLDPLQVALSYELVVNECLHEAENTSHNVERGAHDVEDCTQNLHVVAATVEARSHEAHRACNEEEAAELIARQHTQGELLHLGMHMLDAQRR